MPSISNIIARKVLSAGADVNVQFVVNLTNSYEIDSVGAT